MAEKVLILSMPRCSSMSTVAALEKIRYGPTYPPPNYWADTAHLYFDELLQGYEVISGVPAFAFAEELVAAYPEAKVVFVQENVNAWYEDFQLFINEKFFEWASKTMTGSGGEAAAHLELWKWMVRGKFQSSNIKELERYAQLVYLEHYETIRRIVPGEQLLVFKLRDCWEPLCRFLEKQIPVGVEFPRLVNADESQNLVAQNIRHLRANLLKRVVLSFGSVAVMTLAIWLFFAL